MTIEIGRGAGIKQRARRLMLYPAAVLAALALVAGSGSAAAADTAVGSTASSAEQYRIDVSANGGWQGRLFVPAGTWVTIQVPTSGQYWTVDYRPEANLPYVAALGYRDYQVWSGNTACKVDPRNPYGVMLARLGGETFAVAGSNQFGPRSGGYYLDFSINDLEQCQGDNAGSLPVTVIIG